MVKLKQSDDVLYYYGFMAISSSVICFEAVNPTIGFYSLVATTAVLIHFKDKTSIALRESFERERHLIRMLEKHNES